jgi:hypothetical protein
LKIKKADVLKSATAGGSRTTTSVDDHVGDHRHRKTEKEEDEELLSATKQAVGILRFNESPFCKLIF